MMGCMDPQLSHHIRVCGSMPQIPGRPAGSRAGRCGIPRRRSPPLAAGTEICRVEHDDTVSGLEFSTAHTGYAVGGVAGSLDVMGQRGNAVAFSPGGTRVVAASWESCARVFNAETGSEVSHLNHHDEVRAVAFSPDGSWVATACDDGGARVFDAATGIELSRLDHDDEVRGVAFSPDGRRVATASKDGTARVLDVATGAEIARLRHEGRVHSVAFSPDGTRVVGGARRVLDGSGSVAAFDAVTGAVAWQIDHDKEANVVAFSPDSSRLVSATDHGAPVFSNDQSARARVLDAATGDEICHSNHQEAINAGVFSPDGTRVATASADGTAAVFDAGSGEKICQLEHGGVVHAVAFSPDGTRLVTGCSDGFARIWIIEPGQLIEQAVTRVTRNLTEQEWRRYFGGEPYRKTRADLPVPAESGPTRPQRVAGSWLPAIRSVLGQVRPAKPTGWRSPCGCRKLYHCP